MDDTPPPLPSSLPPLPSSLPPLLETSNAGRKRSASKKFLDLQARISSSKTMYNTDGGKDQKKLAPAVLPKPSVKLKRGAGDANLEEDNVDFQRSRSQGQRLMHHTLERPKRKGIRTPTRGSQKILSSLPAMNGAIPTSPISTPPDYDQPPPLPASAPPPEAAKTSDNMFVEEITNNNQLPALTELPMLPLNDPPSLHSESSPLDLPPPLSESPPLPSSLPPSVDDQPPPSSSNKHTNNELPPLPPTSELPSSGKPPTGPPTLVDDHKVPSLDQPSVDNSSTLDMTDSSSFEAPPPLPSSLPPEIHNSTEQQGIADFPSSTIMTAGSKPQQPTVTQSFTSDHSLFKYGSTKQQERIPSPLATNSYNGSLHDSYTSRDLKTNNQSTKVSFPALVPSLVAVNASTSTPTEAANPTTDEKSSSVLKFRDRIARLKQKRESVNPSPALSEKVSDNSRVTSPFLSSFSTPGLEETSAKPPSHKLQADHSTDCSTSISPLLSSSEELDTPVSFPTTTSIVPPTTTTSGTKVVEPTFTVRKISSSRITSAAASTNKDEFIPSKSPTIADSITTVDSHSDSAFTKPWEFNISDTTVVASGLPSQLTNDNDDESESEDDGLPPPLPSSLPPDAFASDSFLDMGEVVSDDAGLPPSIPPPAIPAESTETASKVTSSKNVTEQEVTPPLPTSPVPFEVPTNSSGTLPLVEPFKPLKEPMNTAQEEAPGGSRDLSAPVEFSENIVDSKITKPSASLAPRTTGVELPASSTRKTGLHTAVFANHSPKTVRPFSQYYTKDSDPSLQKSNTKDNRHSVHLGTELDIRSRSNSLPMFVCEQLVTDEKKMKPTKKSSSKLKLPWQKKLVPNSMSTDRNKQKNKYSDSWRHSSADMKGNTSGSDLMIAQHRNVSSLQQVTGQPLASSSIDDLRNSRRLVGSTNSVSTSHSELYNSRLLPPPVQFTASETSIPKLSDDEVSTVTTLKQLQQQQLIKDVNKLAASNISLPHMTTPELYRKLKQPSDPSLLESVMKDIPHLQTTNGSTIALEDDKEVPNEHEAHPPAAKYEETVSNPDREMTKTATDKKKQLDTSLDKSVGSLDSLSEVPSPLGSPLQDYAQSSIAGTPNINEGRGIVSTLGSRGSINTLISSSDSQRDLSKHRVTIGDWSVDNVSHWLKSIDLHDVVSIFQQYSIDGAKLKSLDDDKLNEIGIQSSLLQEQILQEIWELLAANDEATGLTRPRKTKSLLQGISVMRKGLEAQLQERMSEDLTLMQTMGQQQQEMLDSRLAVLREQQEQTQELLGGGLSALMSTTSPECQKKRASRKKSSITETDIDAEYWSVDQVCEWLDQVGLGYYVTIFQEYQIDGSALCSLDMQTFAEMGVDSAEDRETILEQIYELFNPESDGYKNDNMEELLERYSGEDLEKMKAVINALKNPIADDDDLEIESSPPPFYLSFADGAAGIEALSHSTPMLLDANYNDSIPGTPEPRHIRQGSLPPMRSSQRRPPPPSLPYAQFLVPPEQTGGISSAESTPPPLPKRKENIHSLIEDEPQQDAAAISSQNQDQTPSPVATSTPATTSQEPNEVAEQSDKLQELPPVSTEYPTKLAGKLAAKRKQSSGDTLLESLSVEQPKITQPAAATATTAATANSKEVAYKMKQLANQLSHGEVAIESDASGVKISENDQHKKTTSGVGKKINTVKIKAGGMQSGLVRLYMVDIPHFSHVIYQAYLILASTKSHELIEQVLRKADIVDDPYRYYVFERNLDEDGNSGKVLDRNDCPLQFQMEWTNFYGRKFELFCRKTQFVNVQCQIKGLSNDTTQMHITEVTPCSVLITMAANSFNVPESCGKLVIVFKHIKNKREIELSDTDLPLKLITVNNAKYVVFCLRQNKELISPAQEQQQQQSKEVSNAPSVPESIKVLKEVAGNSGAVPPHTVSPSRLTEIEEKCAMLENEKQHLETKLDELQRRYNAVATESNNEAIILMEQENNKLSGELVVYKSKCAQHNQEIAEVMESLQKLQQQVIVKDDRMQTLTITNKQLQEQAKQFQEQITKYQHEETESSKIIQSLKDALEKLTSDYQEKQQVVEQLRLENEQLEQSVMDKKEKVTLNSSTPKISDEMAALKELLSRQENDANSYKKKYQKQTQQLKATEDQLNSMKKVLKQKDEVITQLSEVEPWQSASNRNSLYSMMGTEPVGTLLSVTVEPQETGLGIKLSSTEGGGCLVMQVAEHSPLISTVLPGDRLLEINGEDISNSTTKQVVSLLKNLNEPMQFVILRHGAQDKHNDETDIGSDDMIERLQKLNATLTEQVDKQMAETEHWRSQYEQIRDASSSTTVLQQEKDSEIAYYKTTVEELKEQLTESQKMQEQLQTMLEELHQTHDEHSKASYPSSITTIVTCIQQEATEAMDQTLQEHVEQIEIMDTKHKNQVQALQKSVKEKEHTVRLFQRHLVMADPVDSSCLQAGRKRVSDLKSASQPEVLEALAKSEEEAARHQAYLDKLLVLVIEKCPELLGTMSAMTGNDRNKAEEWC
ncbi:uncharacterized protein [Dysidea avara]|uniref:uncharacterized protein isoform X2 n=1 Tax=Dysidea avara TaxID=196820 RepID=UPI00332E06DF